MSEKIKVLMFGWEFPPHNSGGLGTACQGIANSLVGGAVDLTFVLPRKIDDITAEGIRIRFAETGGLKLRGVYSPLYPYITSEEYTSLKKQGLIFGSTLLEEVSRYGLLAKDIAKEEDFDIIHAHDWLSFLAGIEAKKVSGKPLVVHIHATEFDRTGGKSINQAVYDIEKMGMEMADKVIAVSQFTKDILISKYGISEDKIEVIHNGVDESQFQSVCSSQFHKLEDFKKQGKKIVLFVGRITMQKGPDYFVKVAKRVSDLRDNTLFVIAGDGDMKGQIVEEVVSFGMSDKVIFAGFLRGDDLNCIYRSADIFVMPSVSEPFGITPLEAMTNNTPVIVSRQSGVSEVLRHALKVDFWDIDEMTNKIVAVLDNPVLGETLQENGKTEVLGLNWNKFADKCVSLYKKLLSFFKPIK